MRAMQQQGSNWREPSRPHGGGGGAGVAWGGPVDFAQRLTRPLEHTCRPDGRRWTLHHVADQSTARGKPNLVEALTGERVQAVIHTVRPDPTPPAAVQRAR